MDSGRRGAAVTSEALESFSASVASAWQGSFMASFPAEVRQALLAEAQEATVKADEVFYRGAQHAETAILALIADGLVRTFIETRDGRQVTIRYAWPGDVIGVPAVVTAGFSNQEALQRWRMYGGHTINGEALRDTLLLNPDPPSD